MVIDVCVPLKPFIHKKDVPNHYLIVSFSNHLIDLRPKRKIPT